MFIQILDEQYSGLADDEWRSSNGSTVQHVFMVKNFCDLGNSLTRNDLWDKEFTVKIVSSFDNTCNVCMGAYGGKLPESRLAVELCSIEK